METLLGWAKASVPKLLVQHPEGTHEIMNDRYATSTLRQLRHQSDWVEGADAPSYARFVDVDDKAYLVQDLAHSDIVQVPTQRNPPQPFPSNPSHPVPGVTLVRWSIVSLLSTLLGGGLGIVLGFVVVLAAILGLFRYQWRAKRWRARYPGERLPIAARLEYDRLRAALGQGLIAIFLGSLIALFLFQRFQ